MLFYSANGLVERHHHSICYMFKQLISVLAAVSRVHCSLTRGLLSLFHRVKKKTLVLPVNTSPVRTSSRCPSPPRAPLKAVTTQKEQHTHTDAHTRTHTHTHMHTHTHVHPCMHFLSTDSGNTHITAEHINYRHSHTHTRFPTWRVGRLTHTYMLTHTHTITESNTQTIACSCIFSDTHSAIRELNGESVYKARVIVRSSLKGLPIILVSAGNHLQ